MNSITLLLSIQEDVLNPTATLICQALLISMGDLSVSEQKQRSGFSRGKTGIGGEEGEETED